MPTISSQQGSDAIPSYPTGSQVTGTSEVWAHLLVYCLSRSLQSHTDLIGKCRSASSASSFPWGLCRLFACGMGSLCGARRSPQGIKLSSVQITEASLTHGGDVTLKCLLSRLSCGSGLPSPVTCSLPPASWVLILPTLEGWKRSQPRASYLRE